MREWKARNKTHVEAYQKEWREKNKPHLKAYEADRYIREQSIPKRRNKGLDQYYKDVERARLYQFKRNYGFTAEDVARFDATTNCNLCGRYVGARIPGKRHKLHVDHCHVTGKVRGFICNKCNTGLGKLGDTAEALERALRYLRAGN